MKLKGELIYLLNSKQKLCGINFMMGFSNVSQQNKLMFNSIFHKLFEVYTREQVSL